jgi:hypothetical protein
LRAKLLKNEGNAKENQLFCSLPLSIRRFHAINRPFSRAEYAVFTSSIRRFYPVFTQVKKGNKEQIIWVLHFFVVILQPI